MSRLHLLILWALAIGAGVIYFKRKDVPDSIDSKTKLETGSDLLSGELVEGIDGFKIKDGDKTVTVQKIEGEWVVAEQDNFPANLTTVTRVFEALRDAQVAQGVVASPEYYDRFNLDIENEDADLRPRSLTFLSEGEETKTLYLGKTRTSTGGGGGNAGTFVRLSDDDSGIYVVPESFGFLGTDPDTWIEKVLTPLEEKPIEIEVTAPNDETFKSWTVSRKTVLDDFLVADLGENEETRTNETALLKTAFTRALFTEFVSPEDYEKRANKKGIRKVKATDSAGSTFLITITPEKEEEEPEDQKDDPNKPFPEVNYLVSIEVLNGPTKPEPPAEDADVQAKAVFQERAANLADLSRSVNRMAAIYKDRTFLVNKGSVGSFLKNRGEFIKPKEEKKDPVSVTTKPLQVPTAGTQNTDKQKIEAVTPPIRIPPLIKKPEEATKPDEAVTPPDTPNPAGNPSE